jgi:hypothetical protein
MSFQEEEGKVTLIQLAPPSLLLLKLDDEL